MNVLKAILAAIVGQWRIIRESRMGTFGLMVILFFSVIAILAPWIAPHDPWLTLRDSAGKIASMRPPSAEFPLGTTFAILELIVDLAKAGFQGGSVLGIATFLLDAAFVRTDQA